VNEVITHEFLAQVLPITLILPIAINIHSLSIYECL